jgi:hypothetical protein
MNREIRKFWSDMAEFILAVGVVSIFVHYLFN